MVLSAGSAGIVAFIVSPFGSAAPTRLRRVVAANFQVIMQNPCSASLGPRGEPGIHLTCGFFGEEVQHRSVAPNVDAGNAGSWVTDRHDAAHVFGANRCNKTVDHLSDGGFFCRSVWFHRHTVFLACGRSSNAGFVWLVGASRGQRDDANECAQKPKLPVGDGRRRTPCTRVEPMQTAG